MEVVDVMKEQILRLPEGRFEFRSADTYIRLLRLGNGYYSKSKNEIKSLTSYCVIACYILVR